MTNTEYIQVQRDEKLYMYSWRKSLSWVAVFASHFYNIRKTDPPFQYLNNRSNGENLSSTSDQAELIAQCFFNLKPPDALLISRAASFMENVGIMFHKPFAVWNSISNIFCTGTTNGTVLYRRSQFISLKYLVLARHSSSVQKEGEKPATGRKKSPLSI
jgi:hypothetical protein